MRYHGEVPHAAGADVSVGDVLGVSPQRELNANLAEARAMERAAGAARARDAAEREARRATKPQHKHNRKPQTPNTTVTKSHRNTTKHLKTAAETGLVE